MTTALKTLKDEGGFLNEAAKLRYDKLHIWRRLSAWCILLCYPFFLAFGGFMLAHQSLIKLAPLIFIFPGLWSIIFGYQVFLVRRVYLSGRGSGGKTVKGKTARIYGVVHIIIGVQLFIFGILGIFFI